MPVYPRIVTSAELLEESDDESVFCGPPSDAEESGLSELLAVEALALEPQTTPPKPPPLEETRPRRPPLILPKGFAVCPSPKLICAFRVGIEEDEEFRVVVRIFGKDGCNMKRIWKETHAKLRLRGKGSGFLENGCEADVPLELNVSCTSYENYKLAATEVAKLLRTLHMHYRRYARKKGMVDPELDIDMEELRRDDLGWWKNVEPQPNARAPPGAQPSWARVGAKPDTRAPKGAQPFRLPVGAGPRVLITH